MNDQENMEALYAPTGDPRTWLAAYLRTRAHLASLGSEFHCDPACTRPGCTSKDLQVQVSIVDLLGVARHLEEPVAALYRRYYSLGLFAEERTDWLRMVAVKLRKPCPFLANGLCGIYPVRPLPCILFPEYLAAEDKLAAYVANAHFRDFLCLRRPFQLSPERAGIMARLKKMWTRETLISSFYLFNHASCHLDFSNLTGELLEAANRPGEGAAEEHPEFEGTIPHRVLEGYFLEHLVPCPPFAGVEEKIAQLGNRETQEQFLRLLQDDRLHRRLKQRGEDRAPVYRFSKGKLKAGRRSLLPGEYKFY